MLVSFPATGPSSWCVLLGKRIAALRIRMRQLYDFDTGSVPWVSLLFRISLHFLCQWFCEFHGNHIKEHGMAQWWEHSPPTKVARVQIPVSMPYVGWVCLWFSPLLRDVFLWVLRFSLSSKINISKFQFDQESGRRRTTLWMCYFHIISYMYLFIKENVVFVWCDV